MSRHLFIIGAQRCGTTYLWHMLGSHPEVYMARPIRPEPKYFLGPGKISDSYEAYRQAYFSEAGAAKWFGEKSASYIEREDAANNIAELIPDAQILVILRDPVERAISNYFFTKSHGLEPHGIEHALRKESERITQWDRLKVSVSPHAYIERGKYMQYLEFWERIFGRQALHLMIAEEFLCNEAAIRKLYIELGVDATVRLPNLDQRINASDARRMRWEIPSGVRETLAERFRPWSVSLADHFNLDLSCWRGMS